MGLSIVCNIVSRSNELISRRNDIISCSDDIISRSDDILSRFDELIIHSDVIIIEPVHAKRYKLVKIFKICFFAENVRKSSFRCFYCQLLHETNI